MKPEMVRRSQDGRKKSAGAPGRLLVKLPDARELGRIKSEPWIDDIIFRMEPPALRFGNVDTPRVKRLIIGLALGVHLLLLGLGLAFLPHGGQRTIDPDKVIDIVELQELSPPKLQPETTPPPPPPPPRAETQPPPRDAPPPTALQEDLGPPSDSATAMTVQTAPVAVATPQPAASSPPPPAPPAPPEAIEYTAQFKLTKLPGIPEREFRSRVVYPPLAAKQGIEATVILLLYVDKTGKIRKISVLKDPGFGFAEAAVKAFDGLTIQPGEVEGQPAAAVYRQSIPFKLK